MSESTNLVKFIESLAPETPISSSFCLIQRFTLAFIERVLPSWPLLLPNQLLKLFSNYHGYDKLPRYAYMPPGYQAFHYVLAIGHVVCSFNDNPDKQRGDPLGLHDRNLSDAGIDYPPDDVTDLQAQALADLYSHYGVDLGQTSAQVTGKMETYRWNSTGRDWDAAKDWWTLTLARTILNLRRELLWPPVLPSRPDLLPPQVPDKHCFVAVFGTESWDHFYLKSHHTITSYLPQTVQAAASVTDPSGYDFLRLLPHIYLTIKSCGVYLRSFSSRNPTGIATHLRPEAAQCVMAMHAYVQATQESGGAERLFRGQNEFRFVRLLIIASVAGLLPARIICGILDNWIEFYGNEPANHFVCPEGLQRMCNAKKGVLKALTIFD
ncbi:hypothetical protein PCL_07052 [Purpureocillium lilacinum]|uniref:Uncharacterized protein n=1 Tax=Purpureocillium lilacinum TaxID=33203 RepID=A0A2U3DT72_PURLI|nr:hypothetical protein PCL_07052 [Purpureocillium lilacinum]